MLRLAKFLFIISIVVLSLTGVCKLVSAEPKFLPAFVLTEADRSYLATIRDEPVKLAYSYEAVARTSYNGEIIGMMEPIVNILENDLGLEVELHKLDWSDAFDALDNGAVDIYGFVALSESRKKKYLTSSPMFKADAQVVSLISSPIGSMMSFKDKNMGLLRGTAISRTIETYLSPSGNLTYYSSIYEMIGALEAEEIDCFALVDDAVLEILRSEDVTYEFCVENVYSDQGIIGVREDLRPLFSILNRIIEFEGDGLTGKILTARKETIMQAERERFGKDITYVKQNNREISAFNTGASYPLCYKENGVYKGLQVEIGDVFTELTGVDVKYHGTEKYLNGMDTALESLKTGDCMLAGGGCYNIDVNDNPAYGYSQQIWVDTIRAYAIKDVQPDFHKLRVGASSFVADYLNWDIISGKQSVIIPAISDIPAALKNSEIDVAFFSEMAFNYMTMIQWEYSLREIGDISAKAPVHFIYGMQNTEFNRLFEESIKLYKALYPRQALGWEIKAARFRTDYMRNRESQQVWITLSIIVIFLMFVAMIYLLRRYTVYDKQISQLIRKQQTFDLAWVNIKANTFISKGDHPFFRKWGLEIPGAKCTIDDISNAFGWDMAQEYSLEMQRMKDENLSFTVTQKRLLSPLTGEKMYYRRYLHRLNDYEFMYCLEDITDEKTRERELTQIASTDFLSNLLTRRAMNDKILRVHEKILENGGSAFLIMFDVDNFKSVNDNHGHDVGDKVLVAVADIIQNTDGCHKTTSRWGGEEFLVLMDGCDLETAKARVAGVIRTIADHDIEFSDKVLRVTISAGIAQLENDLDYTLSVNRADQAMYQAKREGKNCYCVY